MKPSEVKMYISLFGCFFNFQAKIIAPQSTNWFNRRLADRKVAWGLLTILAFVRYFMLTLVRKMHRSVSKENINSLLSYEEAVKVLNTLQTGIVSKNAPSHSQNSLDFHFMKKYLVRSGIGLQELDRLSVIHVTGTKGKGSTCAFVEAILHEHGFRTGFYSSPHLVAVRERFRIDTKPISEIKFSNYFWPVYKVLEQLKDNPDDLPSYFKFLTILMFHIFIKENVDVAIIEVGIGGELDCTNIVRNSACTGIARLGLDHTSVLGNDLESIAFQKSGIFKPGAPAFTVAQPEEAMTVIRARAIEKRCPLRVVPSIDSYPWKDSLPVLGIRSRVQNDNASLAIQLASSWMTRYKRCINNNYWNIRKSEVNNNNNNNEVLEGEGEGEVEGEDGDKYTLRNNNDQTENKGLCFGKVAKALESCRWPGRTQFLPEETMDFYIDGAHTVESIEICASWFRDVALHKEEERPRYLIFNATGGRDSAALLAPLKGLGFERAFFVPNVAGLAGRLADNSHSRESVDKQMGRCQRHVEIWGGNSIAAGSVYEALKMIDGLAKGHRPSKRNHKPRVLVTGSLYLVGAFLSIVDPDLSLSTKS